ncbi:MAG: hypothetical protein C4291_00120 [Candidatus Dadabacteria bacterium]
MSIEKIIDYLRGCGLFAQYRGNIFEFLGPNLEEAIELSGRIAGARILDISAPIDEIREPIHGEIDVELKRLRGNESLLGVLYDGLWLQRIFYKIMSERIPEFKSGYIHIIFTSRLFGTYETGRYHARVILTGLPSLISTSGIVEAPAKPKDYYWLKAGFIRAGKDIQELDLLYRGRFIEYDDSRITKALSPYVLQSVFYEITGNPFCDNPDCCLYNSHWQEEVLKAQIGGELCGEHRDIIKRLELSEE